MRAIGRGLLWFFKRIWKPALALFVVAFVVHGVATVVIGRRFAADIAAIKAKGEPVTLAALAGKPVPDERNGAVVYARIFKLLSDGQACKDADLLSWLPLREPYSEIPKGLPYKFKNASDLWSAAGLAARRLEVVVPMVQEAQARPECKFPVNWKAGGAALFPHYAELRKLTHVLAALAVVDAREGRMAEAFHKVELAFMTAKAVKNEPTIISILVITATTRIADNSLRAVLEYGTPDESQARKLYGLLSGTDLRHEFANALKGERAMCLGAFDRMHGNKEAMGSYGLPITGIKLFLMNAEIYAWRPFSDADGRYYLKQLAKSIDDSIKPYRLSNLRQYESGERCAPIYAVITNMLTPIFARASVEVDRMRASTALTQVLVAAQIYKSRVGHYPESISELRAWKIPLDPFSGKDLVYKRTPQGFQVYSIGSNLKDDGGIVPKDNDPKFGDIVLNWKH